MKKATNYFGIGEMEYIIYKELKKNNIQNAKFISRLVLDVLFNAIKEEMLKGNRIIFKGILTFIPKNKVFKSNLDNKLYKTIAWSVQFRKNFKSLFVSEVGNEQ